MEVDRARVNMHARKRSFVPSIAHVARVGEACSGEAMYVSLLFARITLTSTEYIFIVDEIERRVLSSRVSIGRRSYSTGGHSNCFNASSATNPSADHTRHGLAGSSTNGNLPSRTAQSIGSNKMDDDPFV